MIVFLTGNDKREIEKTIKAIRKLRSQVERKLRSGADFDKGMSKEMIMREKRNLMSVVGKYYPDYPRRRGGFPHPLPNYMLEDMKSLDRSVQKMIRESEKLKKMKKAGLNADCVAFNDPLLKP